MDIELEQGEEQLGYRELNSSLEYEDADLRLHFYYTPELDDANKALLLSYYEVFPSILTSAPDENAASTVLEHSESIIISLEETKENIEETYNHHLTYPGYIPTKEMPLAYFASNDNLGCLGRPVITYEAVNLGLFEIDIPVINLTCYFSSNESQLAGEVPTIASRARVAIDVLIMCPGSTIPAELDSAALAEEGIDVPTDKNSPYPQIATVENSPEWCQNLERAERAWIDLSSAATEGWMVSLNKVTDELECISRNNICANSNYHILTGVTSDPKSLVNNDTITISNQGSPYCYYSDGSVSNCPDQFTTDYDDVNSLIESFQLEAMTLPESEM